MSFHVETTRKIRKHFFSYVNFAFFCSLHNETSIDHDSLVSALKHLCLYVFLISKEKHTLKFT